MMKSLRTLLLCTFSLLFSGMSAQNYVKVTSEPADWSGDYLIVYEDGSLALNGGLSDNLDAVSNYVEVNIANEKIAATDAMKAAQVTIEKDGDNYTLQSASGLYFGQTSNKNGLLSNASTKYANTLSLNEDGSVNVVSGGAYLRYNATANQTRFRYYKSSTYTAQKAISLYKYEEAAGVVTVTAPAIKGKKTFVETVSVTLTAAEGAKICYTLDGTDPVATSTVYTEPLTLSETTTVKAIAIEGENLSEVSEATFTKVVPTELTFAEMAALTEAKAQVKVNFEGVLVTHVDGGTVYLRSGNNAAALYNIGLELSEGQVLDGYLVADFKLYNSLPELVVNNDLTDVNTLNINGKPAVFDPYKVTVAALNEGKWLGHYVQLKDVTVETETVDSKTTTYIVQGEDSIACYKGIDLTDYNNTGKTYTINAMFTSIYKGTPQVKPISIEETVPATTVEAVDPACGHYDVMPNTLKLTFSSEVSTLEFGLLRTDRVPGRGYYLEEKDYTINGKEMVLNLPAEYVTNASNMNIILSVVDANNQYVTYAYDAEYLDEGYITLAYTAPVRADIFTMTTSDPAAGEVEKLDVINVTFGEGNTYVGGFDTNKEVVVLNDDGNVVTKAKMAVVEEEFEENGVTYPFPTSTVQFTLETPVTAAGEYTFVIPEATVFNESYNSESEDFGIGNGATYNPEIRINYTVVAPAVEEEYTVNFEKDSAVRHASRRLSAVKLTAGAGETQTIEVANSSLVYNDMTQGEVFVCEVGETLKAEFVYDGSWMHGYVYIDMDADKQFSFDANANDQTGKDLVSYSFYGVDNEDSGYNSAGMQITGDARSTLECPEFKAPTVPGEYRMRYKVDWNSVDAGGCVDPSNHIINNGGTITDVILKVVEVSGIDTVTTKTTDKVYTIDGRLVNAKAGEKLAKGIYIVGGKKVYVK